MLGDDVYAVASELERQLAAAEVEVRRLRWAVGVYRDMLREADALILRLASEPVGVAG